MIVIRIKLKVEQSNKEELLSYLQSEVERNNTLTGCLAYALYQDLSEPDGFLLYEEWENIDVFNDYKNSAAFGEIMAKVFPLLVSKPDSAYFDAEVVGP
jgi:quinol monooxygenase YgiN